MACPTASLTELRHEVQGIFTAAGLRGVDHVPEHYTPPLAVVSYGSPMIEAGTRFGAHTVRLETTVVVGRGSNANETDQFDRDITTALLALIAAQWSVERVEEPVMISNGNAAYLAATIAISTQVLLKEIDNA